MRACVRVRVRVRVRARARARSGALCVLCLCVCAWVIGFSQRVQSYALWPEISGDKSLPLKNQATYRRLYFLFQHHLA